MTKFEVVKNYIDKAMENNKKGKYQDSINLLYVAQTLNNNHILKNCSDGMDY
jgi:hypothetical protein